MSGLTATKIERPVSDELPAVDAHRFSKTCTSACGRKHEFDMMPESGRTGDVLVQPQGAG